MQRRRWRLPISDAIWETTSVIESDQCWSTGDSINTESAKHSSSIAEWFIDDQWEEESISESAGDQESIR